jgi:hypothetical protein
VLRCLRLSYCRIVVLSVACVSLNEMPRRKSGGRREQELLQQYC